MYGTFFPFKHCRAEPEGVAEGDAEVALTVLDAALVVLLDLTELDPEPVLLPQLPKPDWHPVPQ